MGENFMKGRREAATGSESVWEASTSSQTTLADPVMYAMAASWLQMRHEIGVLDV